MAKRTIPLEVSETPVADPLDQFLPEFHLDAAAEPLKVAPIVAMSPAEAPRVPHDSRGRVFLGLVKLSLIALALYALAFGALMAQR